jgi:hypothetical protein
VTEERDQRQHGEQREPYQYRDQDPAHRHPIATSAWTTLTALNGDPAIVPV